MTAPTPRNTIRTFALVCVAATSIFVVGMGIWLTILLTTKDWCATALGAAKSADSQRPESAVSGCFNLMHQQVDALALNSHIYALVIALCLFALMVIVVAGGHVSFKASKTGVEADIGSDAAKAADAVANAAVDKATDIKEDAKS